jgi:dihydrofolate synthase / folylpolyglutamate synthase
MLDVMQEQIDWLFAQQERGMHPGLERVQRLLDRLGNPERSFKAVQVGGTNGKGSVTRLISSMMIEAAKLEPSWGRIGEYTSPHLHRFNERVRVDGLEIPDVDLARLIHHLRDVHTENPATFFELVTALACLHFRERDVRWAVFEVGLGGRLDATTAVPAELSVITNIGMDHMDYLGDTLEQIAFEKAGILRANVPAVTGASGVALEVIQSRARELNVPLWVLGDEIQLEYTGLGLDGLELVVETPLGRIEGRTRLRGDHQASNAALAIAAAQRLGLPPQAILSSLENAQWPGRLDLVPGAPQTLVDAAHNPDGARALARFVSSLKLEPVTLIVAGLADKDLSGIAAELGPIAQNVIATRPRFAPRAALPDQIAVFYPGARVAQTVPDALEIAKEIMPKDGLIVVAGTIALAAEALEHLQNLESEGRDRLQ